MSARKTKKPVGRPFRHAFVFRTMPVRGEEIIRKVWCKVLDAKEPVELIMKAEYVRESLGMGGSGNTQYCAGAICSLDQPNAFKHKVAGYIDWQYTRAYVASELKNGEPSECVVYRHQDNIAKLFDTHAGQRKLLKELERDGPRTIRLIPAPAPKSKAGSRKPVGVKTGERLARAFSLKGAALRHAVVTKRLGGPA